MRKPGPTTPAEGSRPDAAPPAIGPLVEIANAIVHLYKDAFGRGPTKARAFFSGSDVLVVMLQDSLTLHERNLLALGEYARVREQRTLLGLSFEDQKRSEIERILRRRIAASIFGFDPRSDLAAEIFTLEPSAEADHGPDDQSPRDG